MSMLLVEKAQGHSTIKLHPHFNIYCYFYFEASLALTVQVRTEILLPQSLKVPGSKKSSTTSHTIESEDKLFSLPFKAPQGLNILSLSSLKVFSGAPGKPDWFSGGGLFTLWIFFHRCSPVLTGQGSTSSSRWDFLFLRNNRVLHKNRHSWVDWYVLL